MWQIQYTSKAAKSIRKLDKNIRNRIKESIEGLQTVSGFGEATTGTVERVKIIKNRGVQNYL